MNKTRLFVLIGLLVVMPVCIPLTLAQENVPVRVGMTKDELFKVYPQDYQINYFQKFDAEIYTFDDYLTKSEGDIVTFCLRDGKVVWWDKEKANPTPEERLDEIIKRSKRVQPLPLQGDIPGGVDASIKRGDRLQKMQPSNVRKYNKGEYSQ